MGAWPFHRGELEAQQRAGGGASGGAIHDAIAYSHRVFFEELPFVAIATLDGGWPVSTVLTGAPGFVSVPDPHTLRVDAALDPADPACAALAPGGFVGLLGIDLAEARRSRVNGVVSTASPSGVVIGVRQSFGNCPMYIQERDVEVATRDGRPVTTERLDALDDETRATIRRADTFFVASAARLAEAVGGVDISHRGGRPGFVRIDGGELTIPDFRGNRYFNTFGNLIADPRASLLFVDFDRGDLLQLQGTTEIIWGGAAVKAFVGAERLWKVRLVGGWRRRGVVPLRWTFRELAPTTLKTGTWR